MKTPTTIAPKAASPQSNHGIAQKLGSPRCFLLGLPFQRMKLEEVVEDCIRAMEEGSPRYLATPNVDFARCAASNPDLSAFLAASWRNACDGLPLVWLSRLLGDALPERVAGSDLTPKLLERCSREGLGVFFLGSDSDTLREAARKLALDFPGIDIRGWHAPPVGPVSDWDHTVILRKLKVGRPDLVLVATGSPKQEEWISRYQKEAGIPLCIGVGASLDFVTGKQVRAPRWVQRIGMEWFWRMSRSPRRLAGRYAADIAFFFRAAFRQWRFHRFWKAAGPSLAPPVSEQWTLLDVADWLASGNARFPEAAVLLDTGRLKSFNHKAFNRFAGAVMEHRLEGFDCALWNPPNLMRKMIESFGWQAFLPAVRSAVEARAVLGGPPLGETEESPKLRRTRVLLSAGMIQGGRSGVGRYVIELARQLSSADSGIELHVAGMNSDRGLFPEISDNCWIEIPGWAARGGLNFLWHQTALRARLRKGGYVLAHIPSYRRILWRCPVPQVATIHDCAPFELRDKYGALRGWFGRRLVPILARKCDHVITVSRVSAAAIGRFMRVERAKITTISNGIDHGHYFSRPKAQIEDFLAERGEKPGNYFLYVARLEHPGKNHLRLIEAFEIYREENPGNPVRLLFAGADWHGASEIHGRIRNSNFRESIRCLGFVPEADLPFWYGGARAMVMPTRFEGFGLPVVEALACGTLVACSDIPVLREVGGTVVSRFDFEDPAAISRALTEAAELSDQERDGKIQAGLEWAADYDWSRVGKQTAVVYLQHLQKVSKIIVNNSFIINNL